MLQAVGEPSVSPPVQHVSHTMMHGESFHMGHSGAFMWIPCSLDSHEEGPSQASSRQASQRDADVLLPVPSRDLTSSMAGVKQHPPSLPTASHLETSSPACLSHGPGLCGISAGQGELGQAKWEFPMGGGCL